MWRPVAVWLAVSAATGLAGAATPGAWAAATASVGTDRAADLLVAGCTAALAAALGWLWVITTSTVTDLLRGITPRAGATRRLVLLACGAAVVTGAAVPAHAADGADRLAGLPLPERAVAVDVVERSTAAAPVAAPAAAPVDAPVDAPEGHYVVRPGDSLWSIALDHPGAGDVDSRWREIWAANRDVIGTDPDLIHPGQALDLPGTTTDDTDGDR